MERFYSQLLLGFDFVTGIRTVTSKWSPESAVDFEGVKMENFGTVS
jgi:hypothetical protein